MRNRYGKFLLTGFVLLVSGLIELRADDRGDDPLAKQVTIRRDTFGVPHILAQTEEAAYFGHGYASAEDHVLVLGRLFLQARGEEAAHFGEKFADNDFRVKTMRMHEGARSGYDRMPPWVQRIIDAYAAGYNRFVTQHRAELPDWVLPVTGVDVLAHARRVILLEFCMDLRQLERIGGKSARLPRSDEHADMVGSNMWGLGKERTVSGKGILLGNPHLRWAGSQLFYESHLTVPGKVNLSGTSLIGTPGIAIGFNEHLGWSHTVNQHDSEDVYELTLAPGDPPSYVYDGKPVPLARTEVAVQVKTDKGLETRRRTVYWSHYGPVLLRQGDKAYALKSASIDECRFVEQWNLMGKARTLEEFRHALDMQALPMFNICYADKEGNCFYLFNGRFPDRPSGYNWAGVVPGNTSASEWNRILPQSRLPSLVNPPGGYVQNCNSAPWYTNLQKIIDRRKFPPDLTPNFNDLRQQHSLEMLDNGRRFTLEDVKQSKNTMKLLLADRVKKDLVQLAQGQTVEGTSLQEAARVLEAWDNTVARDSKGSVLFVDFWRKYTKAVPMPFAVDWDESKPASTPYGIRDKEKARQALAAAMRDVKERFGSLSVPWGDVYRLRRGKVDIPVGGLTGEFGAFRVIGYQEQKDGKFLALGGDSYVLAVEFTNPPTAYSILAYSQSDDPRSPHYTDQTELFAREKWKRAWFTEEDIAKNLERSYHP
jgi:acyl-homoserine-lactone acylase